LSLSFSRTGSHKKAPTCGASLTYLSD
jgi:hypothetical protein